jgi:hypothetical protein
MNVPAMLNEAQYYQYSKDDGTMWMEIGRRFILYTSIIFSVLPK